MAKSKKPEDATFLEIEGTSTLEVQVYILGTTPFLCNRLSEKAKHELLLPAPKKNAAERAMILKHQPYQEYRASVYRSREEDPPARIIFPGGAFRKAIATAALDLPGSSKAQIGRLVTVAEYNVHVYGVPQICCMMVRQAGMQRTPDVRTRAILPRWACEMTIKFPHPLLREKAVMALLAHAGDFVGVGDGRVEKGSSLSCGCFRIVAPTDPAFLEVKATGRTAAQDEGLDHPEYSDDDTRDLLLWFDDEVKRRDREPVKAMGPGRRSVQKTSDAFARDGEVKEVMS